MNDRALTELKTQLTNEARRGRALEVRAERAERAERELHLALRRMTARAQHAETQLLMLGAFAEVMERAEATL